MANEKYLTYEGLGHYTEKIKDKIQKIPVGTFIGNFQTKADLLARQTSDLQKNDYAVVEKDDEPYKDKTTRYRWTGAVWAFEYVIENNDCIKLLGKEPGSGEDYHFPFNIRPLIQNTDAIVGKFDTITLDNKKEVRTYDITLPSANPMTDKAGLYTKALADKKADADALILLGQKVDQQDGELDGRITAEVTRATTAEANMIQLLGNEIGSGKPYNMTYYYDIQPQQEKIVATVKTITLDNKGTLGSYSMDIPAMTDITAGLYTKTLADRKVNVSDIYNGVDSTSITVPLSANMGKELNDRMNNLSGMGRFLSTWDCATGKPGTEPVSSGTYEYKTGDYYIVSNVGTGIKYRPDGTTYTHGSASTVQETLTVAVNDTYRFDGTVWALLHTDIPVTSFAVISGKPNDNAELKAELDAMKKATSDETTRATTREDAIASETQAMIDTLTQGLNDEISRSKAAEGTLQTNITAEEVRAKTEEAKAIQLLGKESGSGEEYHFPYYYDIQPKSDGIYISMKTITLDNKKTLASADFTVPQAIVEATPELPEGMAGLYTKALAEKKVDVSTFETLWSRLSSDEQLINQNSANIVSLNNNKAEKGEVADETTRATQREIELASDINLRELLSNKVAGFQATPDDTHYPSEKLVYDKLNLKTDRELTIDGTGKSIVSNLTDDGGAVMKFEHIDGTWSGVAVNNGGETGICAQIYAVNGSNPSGDCRKLNVKKSGIYYMKNKATGDEMDDDEIATIGDIKSMSKIRRETLEGASEYSWTLDSSEKCIVQVYGETGEQIIPSIKQVGAELTLTFENNTKGVAVILQ